MFTRLILISSDFNCDILNCHVRILSHIHMRNNNICIYICMWETEINSKSRHSKTSCKYVYFNLAYLVSFMNSNFLWQIYTECYTCKKIIRRDESMHNYDKWVSRRIRAIRCGKTIDLDIVELSDYIRKNLIQTI